MTVKEYLLHGADFMRFTTIVANTLLSLTKSSIEETLYSLLGQAISDEHPKDFFSFPFASGIVVIEKLFKIVLFY